MQKVVTVKNLDVKKNTVNAIKLDLNVVRTVNANNAKMVMNILMIEMNKTLKL